MQKRNSRTEQSNAKGRGHANERHIMPWKMRCKPGSKTNLSHHGLNQLTFPIGG